MNSRTTARERRAAMSHALKHRRRLKAIIVSRVRGYLRPRKQVAPLVTLPPNLAVAHTLADIRHICAELKVDYAAADRLGGVYYTAETEGSVR